MRWLWIDRIVELVPRQRLVAVKSVSFAEDHLAEHFPPRRAGEAASPLMPASLIIEGMAQAAGILVADAEEYREKVILAKINLAELDRDAPPGTTLRYTAVMQRIDRQGASTSGTVDLLDHAAADRGYQPLGRIDLMFSHIDRNMAGLEFPQENFVFGESFKTLLRQSGIKT
jgi:3-hydroxyacyl-[acyl-carrier-protein] dehydratase